MFKHLFASLLILCSFLVINAQNIHPDYYDGKIWFRLQKSHIYPHSEKGIVDAAGIAFLKARPFQEAGVNFVKKPFHFAKDISLQQVYEIHFTHPEKVYDLVRILNSLDFVDYAEQVPIMRTTLIPNDAEYSQQYALPLISAPIAWDITTGNSNIIVAVVDDAVKITHPDLAPSCIQGYDVANNDNNPNPDNNNMSHGTHVAGIIGAASNNNIGVASIGFGVSILPVKSSDQAQYITDGYAGIIWAADNGAHVINMSWGGSGGGQSGQNVINYAYNAGCVLVAAAGNDNVSTQFYPAAYNNVISVASTTSSDAKSSFSNYGSWIDISAPGSAIRSTYFNSSGTNNYSNLNGTSMASPMVAGLCGLMLSLNPSLTQTQLTNCLLSSADNISSQNPGYNGMLGSGRINAYQALMCVQTTVNAPPNANISPASPLICPGGTVSFNGVSTGGVPNSYSWSFPGGSPASSTLPNPVVTYNTPGTYQATVTMTNTFGTDVESVTVTVGYGGTTIVMAQDFESSSQIPTGWTVGNPDNSITWAISNVSGNLNSTRAASINLYNYNSPGARDQLNSPSFSLVGITGATLNFSHAHRRYSASYADSLIIKVSTNNGNTWTRIFAAAENGTGNFATNSILNQNFVPATASDWCFGGNIGASCFTLNLGAYDGQANVRLQFESYNDYGNNIYLDDIEVSGICSQPPVIPPVSAFSANQDEICAGSQVQFTDMSANNPTSYAWTFTGGTPSSSTQANPLITYNTPGTYPVALTTTNSAGTNTLTLPGYIIVNPGVTASFTNNNGFLTASPTGTGYQYQWLLNGNPIPGANQSTHTATVSGNYSVQITTDKGCSGTSGIQTVSNVGLYDEENISWSIYPNPATEGFRVTVTDTWKGGMLRIRDMAGRDVQTPMNLTQGVSDIWVPLTGIAAGVYTVELCDMNGVRLGISRVVVQR